MTEPFPKWWWKSYDDDKRFHWAAINVPRCIVFCNILVNTLDGWNSPNVERRWYCQECDKETVQVSNDDVRMRRLADERGMDIYLHLKSEAHRETLMLKKLGN